MQRFLRIGIISFLLFAGILSPVNAQAQFNDQESSSTPLLAEDFSIVNPSQTSDENVSNEEQTSPSPSDNTQDVLGAQTTGISLQTNYFSVLSKVGFFVVLILLSALLVEIIVLRGKGKKKASLLASVGTVASTPVANSIASPSENLNATPNVQAEIGGNSTVSSPPSTETPTALPDQTPFSGSILSTPLTNLPPIPKKKKISKKVIIFAIITFFLLLTTVLAFILVKQRQEVRKRAEGQYGFPCCYNSDGTATGQCRSWEECGTANGACGPGGKSCCSTNDNGCSQDSDCCSGHCCSGTCRAVCGEGGAQVTCNADSNGISVSNTGNQSATVNIQWFARYCAKNSGCLCAGGPINESITLAPGQSISRGFTNSHDPCDWAWQTDVVVTNGSGTKICERANNGCGSEVCITPSPSVTVTPTPTGKPSTTPTPTVSITTTPTLTISPTPTPTPGGPTSTPTPTFTPTPTPTPTPTSPPGAPQATPTPTIAVPKIPEAAFTLPTIFTVFGGAALILLGLFL